jgi:hypothetical protein
MIRWIVGLSVLSFLVGIVFSVFGPEIGVERSTRSDAYSASALGHRAFIDLLGALDIPVLISRQHTADRTGDNALLVIAEPRPSAADEEALAVFDILHLREGPTLLVLPKWRGSQDFEHPQWVSQVTLIDQSAVAEVLDLAGIGGQIVRKADDSSLAWSTGAIGIEPRLVRPQLIRSAEITPIVAAGDDILLGRVSRSWGEYWILSDPDVLANHGLLEGDNAVFAATMISQLVPELGAVVFDETNHGYTVQSTVWSELFRYPLVLTMFQAAVMIAVLVWAFARRFGAPALTPPRLKPGKEFLISNTADLIRFGGYSAQALGRYYQNTLRGVGQRLHAPSELEPSELYTWLQRAARRREPSEKLETIDRAVNQVVAENVTGGARVVLDTARRIHHWKLEMLNEPGLSTSAQ